MFSFRSLTIAVLALLCFGAAPASAAPTIDRRAAMATRFIASQQQEDGSIPALDDPVPWTADGVVALVAARRGPRTIEKALDYLEASSDDVTAVGTKAKVLLAWVAGGRDPKDYAGRDLAAEIASEQQADGRYGPDTSVFSHSIAMLALAAASQPDTLQLAAGWLAAAQCGNGGWQVIGPPTPAEDEHCSFGYPDIDEANADTTSLAIQALLIAPDPVEAVKDPWAFLDSLTDKTNGGWSYDRPDSLHSNFTSKVSNANTTGMVLQAYAAADQALPDGAIAGLTRLQGKLCGKSAGSFYYSWSDEDGDGKYERSSRDNLAATIAAVPGLLLKPLPQPSAVDLRALPKPRGC